MPPRTLSTPQRRPDFPKRPRAARKPRTVPGSAQAEHHLLKPDFNSALEKEVFLQ
jgi:hypothetical protein